MTGTRSFESRCGGHGMTFIRDVFALADFFKETGVVEDKEKGKVVVANVSGLREVTEEEWNNAPSKTKRIFFPAGASFIGRHV